ncbi:MAG TPA: redoxin domain-containing protein, partial [Hyphomicrobiaceae bacterium]|nr:redoxin domain-containing protein [Hyphomicrobiaceae bacterium]
MQPVARRTVLTVGLGGAAAIALDVFFAPSLAHSAPQARIGEPAPAFTLADSNGKAVSLADFKGKTVVLEWTNHNCPYVRKHYGANNMQMLQKKWTARG